MKPIKYKDHTITFWVKPIPDRSHDYEFVHDDYDGGDDIRCGTGNSVKDCMDQIDEYFENFYSAINEENYSKTC